MEKKNIYRLYDLNNKRNVRLFLKILNFETTQVFRKNLKSWNMSLAFVCLIKSYGSYECLHYFQVVHDFRGTRASSRYHAALAISEIIRHCNHVAHIVCIPRISRCTEAFVTFSNIVWHTRFPWHTSKMSPRIAENVLRKLTYRDKNFQHN